MTSIPADLDKLELTVKSIRSQSAAQQKVNYLLINHLVQMHQKYRIAKQYEFSDAIRDLLANVGVKITQGTDGMTWQEIEVRFKGKPHPQVQDTWRIQ